MTPPVTPPVGRTASWGPIEWIARAVCELSRWGSLSFLLPPWKGRRLESYTAPLHLYILAWLAGLLAILYWGPVQGTGGTVVVVVAFYRLQDLLVATLDQALELTGKRNWVTGSWQAPVLIALVNLVQVVVVFAIAYQVLIGDPNLQSTHYFTGSPPPGPFGHLFLSWRSVPPLGSGYVPVARDTQILAILESASALLMITITLSRFLKKSA